MTIAFPALKTEAEIALGEAFATLRPSLPGGHAVDALRASAFDRFAAAGLPHRRLEAWRYTDLRRLMRDAKPVAPAPDAAARLRAQGAGGVFAGLGFRRLVVVDGVFAAELSDLDGLEPGLEVGSMADALARDGAGFAHPLGQLVPEDEPALALNTAFAADGVRITLAPQTMLARPIHVAFIATGATPASMFTRSTLSVGAGAGMMLIETYEGVQSSDYQVNTVLQVRLGDAARLDHVKVTSEGGGALHLATLLADLGARARLDTFAFTIGGGVVRNQAFVRLAGEAAQAGVAGASLLAGQQHADTTLLIEHAAPAGLSRETFKSVVDGAARSVFQGKIMVRQAAQQTDAKMMARALLLSDDAEADSKPELEIFADDVQCGHGATVGALDDQLKFYLMARGIPAKDAEALLIEAFVGEVVEAVAHEGVRDALLGATRHWLGGRR